MRAAKAVGCAKGVLLGDGRVGGWVGGQVSERINGGVRRVSGCVGDCVDSSALLDLAFDLTLLVLAFDLALPG